jgi:hypothetical protein
MPLLIQLLANKAQAKEAIEIPKQVQQFQPTPNDDIESFDKLASPKPNTNPNDEEIETFDTLNPDHHQEEITKTTMYQEDIQSDIPSEISEPSEIEEIYETLSQIEPPEAMAESSYTTSEMTVSPANSITHGLDYFEDIISE